MAKKTKDDVRTEALEAIRKFKYSGAAISMGVGKTRLCLEHFQLVVNKYQKENEQARALAVAPGRKIIKGWHEEADKWDMNHLIEHVDFSTYRSLNKQDLDYDVIYLDECHSLKMSHNPWLKNFKGIIIGVTGTPPKWPNSDKAKMINAYCPIRYTYLIDDAIDDKILNDYTITVHMLELSKAKNHKIEFKDKKGNVTKSWYTSEAEHYNYLTDRINSSDNPKQRQFSSIMRMTAMKTFATKDDYAKKLFNESKVKTILFANEQKQADKLCKHSYHSNNKDSEENMRMFEDGTITKLSCVLQLSQGANIKGLKQCIILHAYGNNRQAAQRIGRMLRLNPDDVAHIDILCFKETQDVKWVKEALESFDQSKITWYDPDIF
jgi:superfamily II DNA or RNA helicase